MATVTIEELEARKQKAVALLNTHADKYRVLYSDIVSKEATQENIDAIELKRKMLQLEADSIHSQIGMLNELEYYVKQETASE